MDGDWRKRFIAAIEADDRSLRSISLAAKLGPNFLSQLIKTGRAPAVDNFLKLTTALGVSPTKILLGVEMTPEDDELLRLSARLSKKGRAELLSLFQELQARERD